MWRWRCFGAANKPLGFTSRVAALNIPACFKNRRRDFIWLLRVLLRDCRSVLVGEGGLTTCNKVATDKPEHLALKTVLRLQSRGVAIYCCKPIAITCKAVA